MLFKGFSGGIHPAENKHFSAGKPFSNLSVPHLCYIPLQQHIGKPARPVVEAGQTVGEGQLIGEADGFISSNIHASIPGKVVEIREYPTVYTTHGLCVVIETEGAFSSLGEREPEKPWQDLSKEEMINRVREAGIVGLGGAAFPTQVKLSPPPGKTIDTLVINGAECEPYLTVDDMLMQTHAPEIIEGIRMTMKILGTGRAIIGVEKNKPRAIKALGAAIKAANPGEKIELVPLKTKYPQGAEKQLIKSVLRREVPSGGLPMDAGVVVQNVGTIFAIREAVKLSKPLFERYITVTGSIVNNPGNYKVRIGTRISDIVAEIGGLREDPAKIVMGGPMCGISLDTTDIPVVKGTSGILFLGKKEIIDGNYKPCIRCGRCVSVCPSGLLPCDICNAVETNHFELVEALKPFDCIMCGSCSYVCPSRRPISHFIKTGQQRVRMLKK
jgi:electron transport complex protein RnfC